jgi:hypothetical protein
MEQQSMFESRMVTARRRSFKEIVLAQIVDQLVNVWPLCRSEELDVPLFCISSFFFREHKQHTFLKIESYLINKNITVIKLICCVIQPDRAVSFPQLIGQEQRLLVRELDNDFVSSWIVSYASVYHRYPVLVSIRQQHQENSQHQNKEHDCSPHDF